MKKKIHKKSLILAKGKKINIKTSWEDFEDSIKRKYGSKNTLSKYQRKRYEKLELEIEELYYNGIYDRIYELLMLDDNGTYEKSIIHLLASENAAKYGTKHGVNIDVNELESRYQEHLFNLLDGISTKPLLKEISFFQNFKIHCIFITKEYIKWIFRYKRVGDYRHESLENLKDELGYEPIDERLNVEAEVITKLYIEDKSFTTREQLVMKAIIKENKISQRKLIGIDGMKALIQVQRVYKNIKKKWES